MSQPAQGEAVSVKRIRRFVTLCGRVFLDADPAYFPSAPYRGRAIRFCTTVCIEAFQSDPQAFYKAHRNSEKNTGT